MCRYVALALLVFVIFKELVKVGVVLFLLVRRGGKVPPKFRRYSCLVVVITPVGIGSHSSRRIKKTSILE